jgi:hypothetical protein
MFSLIFIVPGLIATYFMLLRPFLEKFPALQKFYTEADGFWAKVWAICGKSITMAWSYGMVVLGLLLNQLDSIAATAGDPNFKDQVASLLHSDPKYLGYFTMAVSLVTIAARLRSIGKAS